MSVLLWLLGGLFPSECGGGQVWEFVPQAGVWGCTLPGVE